MLFVIFGYLFFAFGMQPIENSLVASMTPAAYRGRAYAAKFVLAFGIGSIGAYAVGWVTPLGGLGGSLLLVGLLEVVIVICAWAIWSSSAKRSARGDA